MNVKEKIIKHSLFNETFILEINGEEKIRVSDYGKPEDNCLSRDLNFVYDLKILLKLAFDAGKNKEEFILDFEELI
jgi:hypothetical protein